MRKIRKLLMVVLAAVFVLSAAHLLRQSGDYWHAGESREQARTQAGLSQPERSELPEVQIPLEALPPEPEQKPLEEKAAYLWNVDLDGLRQTSSDVLGWISIPGTQLDYPFLQGEDNQYYLNHTWQGKRNAAGSVFLECKVNPQFSDFNTIIYAHNMKNGSMFGSLRQYRTQSHYEANPSIYIMDDSGLRRYEIFAAFEAEVVGYTYRLDVNTPEKKQAFLDYSAQRSVLETDVVPTVEDRVITLSTCTGNGYDHRWVVQAVLTGTFTEPELSAPEAAH